MNTFKTLSLNNPFLFSFCTYVSANTIRVFVTFSMVNLVFPPFPATLPMALDKWSPFKGFTADRKFNTHQTIRPHECKRVQKNYEAFQSG